MITLAQTHEFESGQNIKKLNDLFSIISIQKKKLSPTKFGEFLIEFIPDYFKKNNIEFKLNPPHKSYTRHYIGRAKDGLESMIADWKEDGISSVHGHPDFVFYYVIEGRITMRIFEERNGKALYKKTITLKPGEAIFHAGAKGKFNNFIHQVIAKEPTKSLHIYSDDALKGTVYVPQNII